MSPLASQEEEAKIYLDDHKTHLQTLKRVVVALTSVKKDYESEQRELRKAPWSASCAMHSLALLFAGWSCVRPHPPCLACIFLTVKSQCPYASTKSSISVIVLMFDSLTSLIVMLHM